MENYGAGSDGLFLLSCLITVIIIVIPIMMFLWYQLHLKQSHYFDKEESLSIDKSFEDWVSCEEGERRFLSEKCRSSLIFSDQEMENLIKLS
jgi:hypothetical protein